MKRTLSIFACLVFVLSASFGETRFIGGLSDNLINGPLDFTTCEETDAPGKVTVTPTTITLTDGDRDEDCYVTKDFGSGYFGDFTHWVDVNVTNTIDPGSAFSPWALSNADDDLKDIEDASGDCLFAWLIEAGGSTNTHYFIRMYSVDGGVITEITNDTAITQNTPSYLAISRIGTTLTIQVYSSTALRIAGGTGDVTTLSCACVNAGFRYVYGLGSYNVGSAGSGVSATVSNLTIR